MTAYPSDLVYQANTARRQELIVDAAIERRAGQLGCSRSCGAVMVERARQYIGSCFLALGRPRQRGDDAGEQRFTVES